MFRLYRQFVEQVLLILVYLRYGKRVDIGEVNTYATRPSLPLYVTDIANRVLSEEEHLSIDEMISELIRQIEQHRGDDNKSAREVDLIDNIVSILNLPFARNALNRGTLYALRQALLLPEEMAALNVKLKQRELTCSDCGHILRGGEMVTLVTDGRDVMLACTRCKKPVYRSCDKCEQAMVIDSKMTRALSRIVDCGRHEAVEETPVESFDESLLRGEQPVNSPSEGRYAPYPRFEYVVVHENESPLITVRGRQR